MKKNLLLLKSYLVIMCLIFCPFFVYAGGKNVNDNNIPKKINLQGRYTRSYGDPVTNTPIVVKYQFLDGSGWGTLKEVSTTTDSEGLYNLNLDVNLSSTTSAFRVGIDSAPQGDGYPLASSPYAFYASTAVYALSLDAVNGKPLENGNFDPATKYTITVSSADYIADNTGLNGQIWGIDNRGNQRWIAPGSLSISSATMSTIGGLMLGDNTGLTMNNQGVLSVNLVSGTSLKIENNKILISTDSIPTKNSVKLLTSGSIYTAVSSTYTALNTGKAD